MARINNTKRYIFDTNVTVEDFLIGSDAEISPDGKYLKTKNYKIGDIISLVPTENTDSFNFGYRYTEVIDVNTNPAYFSTVGVDNQIENITSLTFNKVNSEGEDISEFFDTITGNEDNILFNITDGTEDNFGFFKPTGVTNPTPDTYIVAVTPLGTLQKGSLVEGQIYTSTFAVSSTPASGSTDYVSNVTFDGSNLNFTNVGSAFGDPVSLASLQDNDYISNVSFNSSTNELEFTGVGSGFTGNESLANLLSPFDNVDGTPANQSSTNINYNGGLVSFNLPVSTAPTAAVHIKASASSSTVFKLELLTGETSLSANTLGDVWNSGKSGSTDNTFFGLNVGNFTTGVFNSFYGTGVGFNNTTGAGNSFYGYTSGNNNTTGFDNSFFGTGTGFNNTIGANNAFYGSGSGSNNAGGSNNSFYGKSSGNQNTEGERNSFFGNGSGSSNITGEDNTVVGNDSLKFNLVGSENLSLGNRSGYVDSLAVPVNSINQSVLLGSNTKPLSNGGTNEVVIGYNAVGNGSNTVTIGNTSNLRTYNKGVNNISNAYTVATLPTGVQGDVAYVTDADFISYRAVVAGGGSSTSLVFFDGTNWLYH